MEPEITSFERTQEEEDAWADEQAELATAGEADDEDWFSSNGGGLLW